MRLCKNITEKTTDLRNNKIFILMDLSSANNPNEASSTSKAKQKHTFLTLLKQFLLAAKEDIELYANKKEQLIFPQLNSETLIELCQVCESIFREEASLIEIESPCSIVGDLHGHVLDLLRILKFCGLPKDDTLPSSIFASSETIKNYNSMESISQVSSSGRISLDLLSPNHSKYVFLGDIIDRGEFSVETITIIFLLKALYPKDVYIIRGNHEFNFMATKCGFFDQVLDLFNEHKHKPDKISQFQSVGNIELIQTPGLQVYDAFMSTFSYLPFGIRIDRKMLCVHGGIGPQVFSVKSVLQIKRPINDFGVSDVVDSLLWSDPSNKLAKSGPNNLGIAPSRKLQKNDQATKSADDVIVSPLSSYYSFEETTNGIRSPQLAFESTGKLFEPSSRGSGYFYSGPALDEFLNLSDLDILVRAHECVIDGCEEMFHGHLVTIFSASNYCGIVRNNSAVLRVKSIDDSSLTGKQIKTINDRCEVIQFAPLEYLKRPIMNMSKLYSNNTSANHGHISHYNSAVSSIRVQKMTRTSSGIPSATTLSSRNPIPTSASLNLKPAPPSLAKGVSPRDPHKVAGIKTRTAPNINTIQTNAVSKLPPIRTNQVQASTGPFPVLTPKHPPMSTPPINQPRIRNGMSLSSQQRPRSRSEFK